MENPMEMSFFQCHQPDQPACHQPHRSTDRLACDIAVADNPCWLAQFRWYHHVFRGVKFRWQLSFAIGSFFMSGLGYMPCSPNNVSMISKPCKT
jgi:hypothetical protein